MSATRAEAAYVPPDLPLLICGIGKVDAAIAVTAAIAGGAVDHVVNIGTAGALHPDHNGLYLPRAVLQHDFTAELIRELGYDVVDRIELRADGPILATGDSFITDAAVRDRLAERAELVDMEGFAIARACAAFGVRCTLVKHVSDNADEDALDWPAVVDRSARALGDWLTRHVG